MASEGILTGVVEVLKEMLIPVDAQKSRSLKFELKKLEEALDWILAKMADAEEKKQANSELRLWLKRLKDIAYDADDVIDEFSYQTMRRTERESLKYKARDFFSSSNPVAYRCRLSMKINGINNRVDEIVKNMEKFKLQTANNNTTIAQGSDRSRLSSSIIPEIVGRKDDKNKIVDMLTKANTSSSSSDANQSSERVSVISIVGMGGLGKTTLVQLICKDELVIKHFNQIIWVHVSEDFDVENILIKIMESITRDKFDNVSNFDLLVNKVQEKLQRKKFLLVLDDLWNEDVQQWERLKGPLFVGAQGSKILITTRKVQVADVVSINFRYKLEKLQEDECWSIIEKRAFSPGGAVKTQNMTNIGKKIAKKCNGLPLAAKFLGGLMHSKYKESHWLSIQEIDIWSIQEEESRILPILKLSYDNLSLRLKQCFSYCSIFPSGWEIKREKLIQLWMAEGFLGYSDKDTATLESTGNDYFDNLCWSSFFDGVEKDESDHILTCTMHSLVHDLALSVSGDKEYSIVEAGDVGDISGVRHLRLVTDDNTSTISPESLYGRRLRTIVGFQARKCKKVESVFSNKKLRVLEVTKLWIENIPASISKLIHMRYLDLSHGRYVSLSPSISALYNLQTLVLRGCNFLGELPRDIGSLKYLRYLDFSYTAIQFLPASSTKLSNLRTLLASYSKLSQLPSDIGALNQLKHLDVSATQLKELPLSVSELYNLETLNFALCHFLRLLPKDISNLVHLRHFVSNLKMTETPTGIGGLLHLQTLKHFIVREDITDGGGIADLGGLKLLQGDLKICKLENVRDAKDAKEANLIEKQHIRSLDLRWSSRSSHNKHVFNDGAVLEALQPHQNLKTLKIKNFMGPALPSWLIGSLLSSLSNLAELVLLDCSKCKQLPSLGHLQNLKLLHIRGMNSVTCLGSMLYFQESNTATVAFPSLTGLTLDSMESLEEWVAPPPPPEVSSSRSTSSFSSLEKLTVSFCTKLSTIPTPFTSLKELKLQSCHALTSLPDIQCLTSVWKLTIRDCKEFKLSPNDLKCLTSIAIRDIDTPISPF